TLDIADALGPPGAGTVSNPHDQWPASAGPGNAVTRFEVTYERALAAARRHVEEGYRPVAFKFASAKHPGGGFLGGARAQEESLCRASGLYACINGNAMYRDHQHLSGGFYTNYAIYSPAVPVFKDDEGELLDEPYLCAFVTAPA